MNAKVLFTLGLILLLFGGYYTLHPLRPKVKIGNSVLTVEVALTEAQKRKGLGDRASLQPDAGMLFPYDHTEQYEFWMRGMQFPLDFIWIKGKTIVDIHENIQPPHGNEEPMIVKPKEAVDKILEVNAGTVQKNGIRIGDEVKFLDK